MIKLAALSLSLPQLNPFEPFAGFGNTLPCLTSFLKPKEIAAISLFRCRFFPPLFRLPVPLRNN